MTRSPVLLALPSPSGARSSPGARALRGAPAARTGREELTHPPREEFWRIDSDDDDGEGGATPDGLTLWRKGRVLGRGGFGVVHEAVNWGGRLIAMKETLFPAGPNGHTRRAADVREMMREASLLARCRHRNVVRVLGVARRRGQVQIQMELMSGGSLAALAARFGGLTPGAVRHFLVDVVVGLRHLHSLGIVHCDLKGANVLWDGAGEGGTVKISDFGAASRVRAPVGGAPRRGGGSDSDSESDEDEGAARPLKGTLRFLAPEVFRGGTFSPASDVWAVGCMAVELATGAPPWPGLADLAVAYRAGNRGEAPPAPPAQTGIVRLCCAEGSSDRPTADELLSHPVLSTAPDAEPSVDEWNAWLSSTEGTQPSLPTSQVSSCGAESGTLTGIFTGPPTSCPDLHSPPGEVSARLLSGNPDYVHGCVVDPLAKLRFPTS